MKAWCVTEIGYEGYGKIVFAETRGKAKAEGASLLDRDFMEVKVSRTKQYDRYTGRGVPADVLLRDGWRFTCAECGHSVYQEDIKNGGKKVGDMTYCPKCAGKGDAERNKKLNVVLLYSIFATEKCSYVQIRGKKLNKKL